MYRDRRACLSSTETILDFQKQIVGSLKQKYPLLYNGNYINLDFHSIPHYGDLSEMEKVWCGAKNKTMKGADTLYHIFAQDLRRFEKNLAPTIFKKFINVPGKVIYDGDKFLIKIRKRAHTLILKDVAKLQNPITVP